MNWYRFFRGANQELNSMITNTKQAQNMTDSHSSPSSKSNLPILAAASLMNDMKEEQLNHKRMRALGDAQLQDHFPMFDKNYAEAQDDMRLNSPQTTTYNQPNGIGPWIAISIAIMAITAGLLGSQYIASGNKDVIENTNNTSTTRGWILESGD